MTNDKIIIKEQISKCYDVNGNLSFSKIKKSNNLLKLIEENTKFLDGYNPTTAERVYCIMNDIDSVLKCPITNEKLKYSPQTKKYINSRTYAYKNRQIRKKPDVKGRIASRLECVNDAYTNGKYVLLSVGQCLEIFEQNCTLPMHRISVDWAFNNIDFACSMIYYTKFLGEFFSDMSERYFCIKNDIYDTPKDSNGNRLKFINRYVGYSKYADRKNRLSDIKNDIQSHIEKDYVLNFYIKDGGTTSRMNLTCKQCGNTFETFYENALWKNIYCAGCYGNKQKSKAESEIAVFLRELGIDDIIENERNILNGWELDLYSPKYKIAIEYCGILWHSFGLNYPNNLSSENDKKDRHYLKYVKCKNLGIRLITIFENEWNLKQDIVKSILRNAFGKNDEKIYARKCEYAQIDKDLAKQFLLDNHIQGTCRFSSAYGLFHNNELVSVACFGKRKITRGVMRNELLRFCSKKGLNIVGGASKIIKNSGEKDFISYCDVRYGTGNLYHELGMTLLRHSKPNYYYTLNKVDLIHRSNFQKHKITHKDDTRTEREIMYGNGYRRIYDCGNLVFEYKK